MGMGAHPSRDGGEVSKHDMIARARRRRLPPVATTRREARALRSADLHEQAQTKYGEVALGCGEALKTGVGSVFHEYVESELRTMMMASLSRMFTECALGQVMRNRAARERRRAERRAGR